MFRKPWGIAIILTFAAGVPLSCAGGGKAPEPNFKGFTLPHRGNADVYVLEDGCVLLGLESIDERPVMDPAHPEEEPDFSMQAWFALEPTKGNVELIQQKERLWLVPQDKAATIASKLGPHATRIPVPGRSSGCSPETIVACSGVASLTRAADGSYRLNLRDGRGRELFTTAFRVLEASSQGKSAAAGDQPGTGMTGEQTSECSVTCDDGQCSVTCYGTRAHCDCQNGKPRCFCAGRLSIEVVEPEPIHP